MFVGGEFFYDSRWQVDTPGIRTGELTFLNGGKACLILICDYLLEQGIKKILLPSYLCPTILNTLEKCGLDYGFYQVHPDLSIDLKDLTLKSRDYRAVYFINYFGFPQAPVELSFLHNLQSGGTLLVEDNAQSGFNSTTSGDFVFNSMRKLCAYDGGYLSTRFDMQPYIEKRTGPRNQRLPLIREYRSRLSAYLFQGKGDRDELNLLYERAEEFYESDMLVEGDADERRHIEHLDWSGIKEKRRENYRYLMNLISDLPQITPLYPTLPEDVMPLGLPVYVNGLARDQLFDELGEAGIGLTIHWDAISRDMRLSSNADALDMSSRMLTLVIDQRFSHKQLDYLALNLEALINNHQNVSLHNPRK